MTTDPRELPLFLAVKDAADVLGVSVPTVTAAIENGRLPAVKLGDDHRATRIRRDDLFPSEQTARDLTVKRLRRLHLQAREARERANAKRLDWLAADEEAERLERQIGIELRLTDLDTTPRDLRTA